MARIQSDAETFTVTDLPPQAEQVLGQTRFQLRKEHVVLVVATVVLFKIEKRMVKKVVTKAIQNQVPQIVRNEVVGLTLNDKFGVIGTLAQAVKA